MTLQTSTPVVFILVKERERALTFYRDTLGFDLRSTDEFGDFLGLGQTLLRMTVLPEHQSHGHPLLGWRVDDLRSVVLDLRDRGIQFTVYDGMGQDELGIWTAPDGRVQVAFFSDPDGNVLSLSNA